MNQHEIFYQLHHKEKPLILANVWNVKSAQLFEKNGYEAVGTSSGAIAHSLGYEDGEKIPFEELLYMVNRISKSITIPISVDFERGYTDDLKTLTVHLQQLIDAGIVGINLEDAQGTDIYLKKLSTIKNYLDKTNQELFINARTDGFLQKLNNPLELTLERAKLYEDAGANGLFVTAISDATMINEIAQSTNLPINVVANPKLSSFKSLADCGVKRISMAVLLHKATYNHLEILSKEIMEEQSLSPLF